MNFVSNAIKFTQNGGVKIYLSWIRDMTSIPEDKINEVPVKIFVNQWNSHLKNFSSRHKKISNKEEKEEESTSHA